MARWVYEVAGSRGDAEFELVDIKDYDLPLLDESISAARMALLLSSHGYKSRPPLSGGLEGWRRAGFAVEPLRGLVSSRLDVLRRDCALAQTGQPTGEQDAT